MFLLFLLIELFFILPMFGGSRRLGPHVTYYINESPLGFEVLTEAQVEPLWDDIDSPMYSATVLLYTWPGPVWG